VPENRLEITTEGGLDVAGQVEHLTEVTQGMHALGIKVSMFVDPEEKQIEASKATGADSVELHTGAYANASGDPQAAELTRIQSAGALAQNCGLAFHAGHGLTRHNLAPIAAIPGLREVNIGHDIIARAVFIGLENAVKEILDVLKNCPDSNN
jgi:pyridoxine 5-phosphate synthase